MEADPADDVALLAEAREHVLRAAALLAEDQRELAQPCAALSPAQRAEGADALAVLLASLSCLADSLQRTPS